MVKQRRQNKCANMFDKMNKWKRQRLRGVGVSTMKKQRRACGRHARRIEKECKQQLIEK